MITSATKMLAEGALDSCARVILLIALGLQIAAHHCSKTKRPAGVFLEPCQQQQVPFHTCSCTT